MSLIFFLWKFTKLVHFILVRKYIRNINATTTKPTKFRQFLRWSWVIELVFSFSFFDKINIIFQCSWSGVGWSSSCYNFFLFWQINIILLFMWWSWVIELVIFIFLAKQWKKNSQSLNRKCIHHQILCLIFTSFFTCKYQMTLNANRHHFTSPST